MRIAVRFTESKQDFPVRFGEQGHDLPVGFGAVQAVTEYIGGEAYEGEYFVTPQPEAQTLPTKNKVLQDDLVVKSIPFFAVSNTSGGNTVYIGSEV